MISEVSAISFLGSCSIAAWRHNSCHCSRFGPCMDFLPHVPTGGMFLLIIEPDYIRETTFIGLRALCSPKLKLSLPSPWPLLPHRNPCRLDAELSISPECSIDGEIGTAICDWAMDRFSSSSGRFARRRVLALFEPSARGAVYRAVCAAGIQFVTIRA